MVTHLVLFKPRPDLSDSERGLLINAFERAIREVPTVRGVRVGQRVTLAAGYESRMPDSADYFVLIDFDDLAGLAEYLRHPSHEELGQRFEQTIAAALVYDFDGAELETLRDLPKRPLVL